MPTDEFEGNPELVRMRARSILLRNSAIAVVVLYAVASLTFQTVNALNGMASRAELLDCTQPTGHCYQEGQKNTAEAVGNINRVIVLAAACAVGVDPKLPVVERQTLIQSCVIDRLAAPTP